MPNWYNNLEELESRDTPTPLVVYGTPGNDVINLANFPRPAVVYAGAGNDVVIGSIFNDVIYGGLGNDKLYGSGGTDWIFGGAGTDWIESGSPNEPVFQGWDAFSTSQGLTTYDDVAQGATGTCALLGVAAALTRRGYDFRPQITYMGHYQYVVSLYSSEQQTWLREYVWFTGSIIQRPYGVVRSVDPLTRTDGEFWPLLLQRAYLQMQGINYLDWRQDVAFTGDFPDHCFTILTGQQSGISVSSDSGTLQNILVQGHSVVASTVEHTDSGIVNLHVYAVDAIQVNGMLRLYNPWGVDGPVRQGTDDGWITVSWAVFVRNFDYFAWV